MAYTQADLDALRAAYSSGTLKVRFADGREVTYPSGADLLARIRTVESEIAAAASGRPAPVAGFATFRRD